MAEDEISLPKATMTRIIKERLPEDMKIAAEANEIIMRCCEEFVHMIATTANEVSEKEKKSTLTPEHILKSLEELGFTSYLDNLNAALEEWKEDKKEEKKAVKEKKAARNNSNMSPEEMLALQQQLFQQAKERTLAAAPEVAPPSTAPPAAAAPAVEQPVQQQQQQQQHEVPEAAVEAPPVAKDAVL